MTRRTAAAMANSGRIAELEAERDALRSALEKLATELINNGYLNRPEDRAQREAGVRILRVLNGLDDPMPPAVADRLAAVVQAEVERRG